MSARRQQALVGAEIFDGFAFHADHALVLEDGVVAALVPVADLSADIACVSVEGGVLAPGFVDLQVNGGGGVLFNDSPDPESLAVLCAAHAPFGTTALLPTLVTDRPEITRAGLAAGCEAERRGLPGFAGLHMEGPHLSLARKGAHDPDLIRPMTEVDLAALATARESLRALISTVAVESVSPGQIARLARAGIVVSLGHTDATLAQARRGFAAGATMATHLFNAMSQLGHREPGLVGASLEDGRVWAGLIADGIHVHPAAIGAALRGKAGPAGLFLVTDAMSVTGTEMTGFALNGRPIHRADGALRLADGTLAGADLTMIAAVRFMHKTMDVPRGEALRMAGLYPARAVGLDATHGHLRPGARADIVGLDAAMEVTAVWIGGARRV